MHQSSSPYGALSWQGLNSIKLVHEPDQLEGWLNLTVSAF